jgi:hypothetical protein
MVLMSREQAHSLQETLGLLTSEHAVCVTSLDTVVNILRAFCHPLAQLPSADQPIRYLLARIRDANPQVSLPAWPDID